MIKRTLYFGNPARLHLDKAQLRIEYPSATLQPAKTVPVEDIGLMVIDHPQVSVSHGLTNALIANNAAILWCDDKHLPNGLVLPMTGNSLFTKKLRCQLDASEPLKKQLWKQCVQAKIRNQAVILKEFGFEYEALLHLAGKVSSGDGENVEAHASFLYWQRLFEDVDGFKRHRFGPPPNHLFNYGYAVLRAVVARSLVASGCLPAVGIFHRNQYNAFCLADDMMEAYRPYLDRIVLDYLKANGPVESEELSKEQKTALLQIPVADTVVDGLTGPLMVNVQRTTASLMRCYEGESKKLALPQMSMD